MKIFQVGIVLLVAASFSSPGKHARADLFEFDTISTADLDFVSLLIYGDSNPRQLSSTGPQSFSIDTTAGTADVDSFFQGNDLEDPFNPGGFLSYELYNTTTSGTVTPSGTPGLFDVDFTLLFELEITSGAFAGVIFETTDFTSFTTTDATMPFAPGTIFSSPGPIDIFVKVDPTGTFPPGTFVGTTDNRTVTVNSVIPEPASLSLLGFGLGIVFLRSRRR